MSQLAIVNAPSSFTAIWSVMRPWLAKETVAKVSVLGANYQKALLELVDAENLPETLGGTCTCADCTSIAEPDSTDKGGVAEMGRCAFSSAGPWMAGRDQRRTDWLKGVRKDIALQPGEIEKLAKGEGEKASGGAVPGAESQEADNEKVDMTPRAEQRPPAIAMEDSYGNEERFEDAKSTLGETSAEESSEDASPGPSTPGVESVKQQLDQVQIKFDNDKPVRRLSSEEAAHMMQEKHPDTRQVQNGDLHVS